jgi:membrane-bound metal-dependent hydrolase YbcI (DUF457 family)
MFAGHIGAAYAIGRIERRINVGTFVFFAMFLDFLLWIFVLTGAESVAFPADFGRTHQPDFDFPYSHGLFASVLWSALAGVFAFGAYWRFKAERRRVALLIALAVFSHFVLDWLVHRPEMPVFGRHSAMLGYGLYLRNFPLALGLEIAILAGGLLAFLWGSRLPRGRRIGQAVLALAIGLMTLGGLAGDATPPSPYVMAGASLALIVAITWVARRCGAMPRPA